MATPETFRKLTDPVIPTQNGTVALDDLLHTVDVSDTSKGAAGTSKRTAIQKIVDVVQSSLNLESGTWTPTLDGATSACSNPTLIKAQYSRVGNIVTCTIYGTVDLDYTTFDSGYFNFDYPFAPTTNNSIGACGVRGFTGQINTYIRDNTINFESLSGISGSGVTFTSIFQYEID